MLYSLFSGARCPQSHNTLQCQIFQKMVQDRAILTMADIQEVVYDLSNVPFPMTLSDP